MEIVVKLLAFWARTTDWRKAFCKHEPSCFHLSNGKMQDDSNNWVLRREGCLSIHCWQQWENGGLTDKLGKVSDQESDKVTGGRLGGWQTNNFKKREEHNEHNTLLLREGLVHWSIQETGWKIEKCAHSVWTGGEYGDGQCGRRSVSKGKTVHNASIEAGTRGRMVTDRP